MGRCEDESSVVVKRAVGERARVVAGSDVAKITKRVCVPKIS